MGKPQAYGIYTNHNDIVVHFIIRKRRRRACEQSRWCTVHHAIFITQIVLFIVTLRNTWLYGARRWQCIPIFNTMLRRKTRHYNNVTHTCIVCKCVVHRCTCVANLWISRCTCVLWKHLINNFSVGGLWRRREGGRGEEETNEMTCCFRHKLIAVRVLFNNT